MSLPNGFSGTDRDSAGVETSKSMICKLRITVRLIVAEIVAMATHDSHTVYLQCISTASPVILPSQTTFSSSWFGIGSASPSV